LAKDGAATEALLGRLTAIEGLGLVITVRGEPPKLPGRGARTLANVERLGDAEARALFLRHAGDQFAADPALPGLLAALDGHPLSIELLAANAAGKPDLRGVLADWNVRRADLLQHGGADDRRTSLRASLTLSLDALGPWSAAHRLFRLMALLPDGMADDDSRTILTDGMPTKEERGAGSKLENARLASRPDGRWRLLAPVREALLADFPPEPDDRARLIKMFLARAAKGRNAGGSGWRDARDELIAEAGNLDAMIGVAAKETELSEGVSDAAFGLAELHRVTGMASTASLPAVEKRFRDAGYVQGEADCIYRLGEIALARSDHDGARQRYEAALPLYRKVGDMQGEADCLKGLADIARERSDSDTGRQGYEAALALYKKAGSVLGEANCIRRLGDIALARSDHETARQRYEAALPLYREIGGVRGEANCIKRLGDIDLARSDQEGARQRFEAALPLYQKIGDALGEANCLVGLGDIALARSDHEIACQRYEAALPFYQKVGNVLEEANCLRRLGDVEEAKQNMPAACECWREALALYHRIPNPHSIGNVQLRLARCAVTPEEAAGHRETARKAWASIDRRDLIAKYLDGGA
jgi:tetratricopeptide (TPR) repeat protein